MLRPVVAALTAVLLTAPLVASAQDTPAYASHEETVKGRVLSFDGKYDLRVNDDRGYVDTVRLHDGTVINPRGLRLVGGMTVTIIGVPSGSYLSANEIDTPYTIENDGVDNYAVDGGYDVGYGGYGGYGGIDYGYGCCYGFGYGYPYGGFGYPYGGFGLAFGFGGGYYGGGYYGHGGYYGRGGGYGYGHGGYDHGGYGGGYGHGGYGHSGYSDYPGYRTTGSQVGRRYPSGGGLRSSGGASFGGGARAGGGGGGGARSSGGRGGHI